MSRIVIKIDIDEIIRIIIEYSLLLLPPPTIIIIIIIIRIGIKIRIRIRIRVCKRLQMLYFGGLFVYFLS